MNTRHLLAAAGLPLAAALLTACGAGAAPAASTGAAPAAPARDTTAACTAMVKVDSTLPPGADPDAPAPSAAEMQAWAASVEPSFTTVRANVPDSLASSIAVLAGQLDEAKQGKRIAVDDPAGAKASAAVDAWVHDTCGFQTLDVVNTAGKLGAVPATLKAGPLSMKFTNAGDPAGFVLLLGRLKDGQTTTPADLDAGKADIQQVADIVTAALPTGPDPAYSVTTLTPGRYVLTTPLGAPPTFTGSVSAAFTVE